MYGGSRAAVDEHDENLLHIPDKSAARRRAWTASCHLGARSHRRGPFMHCASSDSVRPQYDLWKPCKYCHISNERIVKSEAFGSFCSFSMMGVMSSEDEDALFYSDKEGELNVENIMLCARLRIMLAVHSGKGSYTKKNCVRWL